MILRNIPREDDIWVRFLKMGRSCSSREEKKGGFFLIREIAQYMTRWTNCLSQRKHVPEGRVAIHGLCINVRQFLPKRAHPSTSMCIFLWGNKRYSKSFWTWFLEPIWISLCLAFSTLWNGRILNLCWHWVIRSSLGHSATSWELDVSPWGCHGQTISQESG